MEQALEWLRGLSEAELVADLSNQAAVLANGLSSKMTRLLCSILTINVNLALVFILPVLKLMP